MVPKQFPRQETSHKREQIEHKYKGGNCSMFCKISRTNNNVKIDKYYPLCQAVRQYTSRNGILPTQLLRRLATM